jgi:hypothetical protein
MSNPYASPKAWLGEAHDPPLPRRVRILRGCAVTGSALIGMLVPLVLYFALAAPARRPITVVITLALCAVILLFSVITILALVSRVAERAVRWTAMVMNTLAVAFFGYLFFTRSGGTEAAMLLVIPAILNLLALDELRRARAR